VGEPLSVREPDQLSELLHETLAILKVEVVGVLSEILGEAHLIGVVSEDESRTLFGVEQLSGTDNSRMDDSVGKAELPLSSPIDLGASILA
jgi:hypothetical protein